MNSTLIRIKFVLAASVLAAGCSFPVSQLPPAPEPAVELQDQFAASELAGIHEPLAWWESFADPVLNQVVEAVLESNFDLAQAVARVDQARARARIANAVTFPLLNPTAGVVDFDIPTNAGIGAQLDELGFGSELSDVFGISLPDRVGLTTYTFGAEFAYEVDFWGRNRNNALAAGAERLASESDYLSARISVLAETVRTYLELVNLKRQRELALANIEILGERESLAQSRYENGLIDALSLYARRRALRDARAGLPQLEAGLAEAESRLWILLGGFRDDIEGLLPDNLSIAAVGEPVPAGIPADLLIQTAGRGRCAAAHGSSTVRAWRAARRDAAIAVPVRIHRIASYRRRRLVRPGPMVPQSQCQSARPGDPGYAVARQCRTCRSAIE